jgi:hypothetical protein
MPGCSEWPVLDESHPCSAGDYKGTSEIQKLIIAARRLQAAVGDSDAG